MQTLIKLSETHYIIVDDSEIKEGDFYFDNSVFKNDIIMGRGLYQMKYPNWGKEGQGNCKKITHSTKPLERIKIGMTYEEEGWYKIKSIPLTDVKEAIYGYSWKTEFEKAYLTYGAEQYSFYLGFNAHKELVKDKLFTIEDMMKGIQFGIDNCHYGLQHETKSKQEKIHNFIQSLLLPKTEWECCISDGKLVLL